MKRILIFFPAILALLTSCESDPVAGFMASSTRVEVYESILFTNTSTYEADRFEWDFGDGNRSYAINVEHYYEHAGTYTVTLAAYGPGRGVDRYSMTIVVTTTALKVFVEEYTDGYRVPEASVILYPTLSDWEGETNPLVEGFTDANGYIRFENLNPVIYYLDVWHPNHNNYILAGENLGWIMTDPLVRSEENEFVAFVDRIETSKRTEAKNLPVYKLIKVEPRIRKK